MGEEAGDRYVATKSFSVSGRHGGQYKQGDPVPVDDIENGYILVENGYVALATGEATGEATENPASEDSEQKVASGEKPSEEKSKRRAASSRPSRKKE